MPKDPKKEYFMKTIFKTALIALCAVSFAAFFVSCPEEPGNNSGTGAGGTSMEDAIQLAENQWANGNISTPDGEQWFTFNATASTQYIHVTFGTLNDLYVQLYDSNGSAAGSSTNLYGSTRYASRSLTSDQKYYIKVTPFSSSNGGNYQIAFNTKTTAPLTAPPDGYIQLTENQWADGNIPTSGGQQWFTFNATASTQYIHVGLGTLTDLYVELYDSTGSPVGSSTNLCSSTTSTSLTLTPDQKYYIKVTPYSSSDSGTYTIAFNASDSSTSIVFGGEYVEIEMINVPGGSFQMGGDGLSDGDGLNSIPKHSVTLTSFFMSKTEVTQAQYQAVMGTNPSNYIGSNLPVEGVSWYDALVFCNKLSMAKGLTPAYRINNSTDPAAWGSVPAYENNYANKAAWDAVTIVSGSTGYRLPTEAQWEYAAKGGNGSPGNYTYSGSNNVGDVAWYEDNGGGVTHPVGTKAANSLGLYDMSGNVYEWCWDWYGSYPSNTAQTDPQGASSGSDRVGRGGSWGNSARYVRSAVRYNITPSYLYYVLGFRLVRP